jgi:hypothetical protein
MATLRRKKNRYPKRVRQRMKIDRDALIVEYLRTIRDIAKSEMPKSGASIEPLSVYNTQYFPLRYQFKEVRKENGRIQAVTDRHPMPEWKDLTTRAKVELFQLLCEEWGNILYTFNPKIHPDLERELHGKDVVKAIGRRVKRQLAPLGHLPQHHFFIVEGHDGKGAPVKLHIHGMAVVESEAQAIAVKSAVGKAAGQDTKGRRKLPSGNHGRFYYYESGKSWAGYITKNVERRDPRISRRSYVFSRLAVQISREFYEIITGQDPKY